MLRLSRDIQELLGRTLLFVMIYLTGCSGSSGGSNTDDEITGCIQESTATTSGAEVGIGSLLLNGDSVAQSFTVNQVSTIASVDVKLLAEGTPTGVLTLSIDNDSSGSPSGSSLSSGELNIEEITQNTTEEYYTFTLDNPISVEASTLYWIRITSSYARSLTNFIYWFASGGDEYENGKALYHDAIEGRWFNTLIGSGTDLTFKAGCEEDCLVSLTDSVSEAEVGLRNGVLGGDEIAQSFLMYFDRTINALSLKLIKTGTPALASSDSNASNSTLGQGTLTLSIEANSSSAPSGTALAQGTLNVSAITNTAAFYKFTLTKKLELKEDTLYWIRLKASYVASANNLVEWLGNDQNAYEDGMAIYETSTENTWATTSIGVLRDLLFKLGCD